MNQELSPASTELVSHENGSSFFRNREVPPAIYDALREALATQAIGNGPNYASAVEDTQPEIPTVGSERMDFRMIAEKIGQLMISMRTTSMEIGSTSLPQDWSTRLNEITPAKDNGEFTPGA